MALDLQVPPDLQASQVYCLTRRPSVPTHMTAPDTPLHKQRASYRNCAMKKKYRRPVKVWGVI